MILYGSIPMATRFSIQVTATVTKWLHIMDTVGKGPCQKPFPTVFSCPYVDS